MSKYRYDFNDAGSIRDLHTGTWISIPEAVKRLNACERVFNRVIVDSIKNEM